MALVKVVVLDRLEVLEEGNLQLRYATYIEENGVRIAGPIYARTSYDPGADVTSQPEVVQKVAQAVWTPELLDKWQQKITKPLQDS